MINYFDFCVGLGYILFIDVVILFVSIFGCILQFKFDDVYVGMFVVKMGFNVVYVRGF